MGIVDDSKRAAAADGAPGPDRSQDGGAAPQEAQVIVVGAGPAGSSAAFHLARAGVDVLVLEKDGFPREKVCGDGLTPRGVRQLLRMGVDVTGEGWHRSRGMRWVCGERQVLIDWPRLSRLPDFGLTRTRHDFDEILARHAQAAGARLHTGVKVTAPLTDRAGRVVGVRAVAGPGGEPVEHRAPLVIAADGASARLAVALGAHRDKGRPMATAARRYYRSPARSAEEYLELWADLRHPGTGDRLPGYGWIFPLGDGRVNVGLGTLTHGSGSPSLRETLTGWLAGTPRAWGLDEDSADGPLRSAALPMGLNRRPQYGRGLLLVGDSSGAISPWTGEGISQAMESGEAAAEAAALALTRPAGAGRERVLHGYPVELNRRWGRYYRLGNFAARHILSRSGFQPLLNRYIMERPLLVDGLARLLTNLTDEPGHDAVDRVLNTLVRLTPAPAAGR